MNLPQAPGIRSRWRGRSVAVVAAALGLRMLTNADAAQVPAIRVGPNVQVSKAHSKWAHYETWVAADPKNPMHLLGSSMVFNPEAAKYESVVYASFDGGATWSKTLRGHAGWMMGDPVTAFGPDGTAYFSALSLHRPGPNQMWVYRSKDAGKTWLPPTRLPFLDRQAIVLDTSDRAFHGRLYLQGTDRGKRTDGKDAPNITLYTSTDNGTTFNPPTRLAIPETGVGLIVGNNVVTSDGTLVLPFAHFAPRPDRRRNEGRTAAIKVTWSTDGGVTLAPPVTVGSFEGIPSSFGAKWIPWVAVDTSNGPFAGRLYVVWLTAIEERMQIALSYSTDKGKSWSAPVSVNDDRARSSASALDSTSSRPGPHHAMPLVAVNDNGVVGVAWYDRRGFAHNFGFYVRFAASFDGGQTFTPSVRVSQQPYAFSARTLLPIDAWGRIQDGELSLDIGPSSYLPAAGDTAGLTVSADGVFHPFWIDNRTGLPQIWTARVSVNGAAVRNGAPELSALDDVTAKLAITLSNVQYDQPARRVTATVTLKNTSSQSVKGPIKLRALEVKCGQGTAVILNADNGLKGAGAIWQIADTLEPGASSAPRVLHFEVVDPLAFSVMRLRYDQGLVNLRAKVYGRIIAGHTK